MLIDKGEQEHQHGSCQHCLNPTNHLWNDTRFDHWFLACNEECAEAHVKFMTMIKEGTAWKELK